MAHIKYVYCCRCRCRCSRRRRRRRHRVVVVVAVVVEMMELLVGARVELGDALLHAINEENVDAVELLLRAHQRQAGGKKNLEVSSL